MSVCLLALIAIALYKIKFSAYHSDYMSMSQSRAIKGIFAVIIFLSHSRQYIGRVWPMDYWAEVPINYLGQLMVAMFFFYSGYGILQAYQTKENYERGFWKNRILKTLVHFDIAVLLYIVLGLITAAPYSITDYLISLTGWGGVGNSNWFMFVILCLYCIVGVAFASLRKTRKPWAVAAVSTVLSMMLWVILWLCGKESYWIDTLMCFPTGMWIACAKTRIDRLFEKKSLWRVGSLIATAIAFSLLYFTPGLIAKSVTACLFCILLMLLTTYIRVDNPILQWLGDYSFEIYIIQRLPMICLANWGVTKSKALALALAVVLIGLCAMALKWVYQITDRLLFSNRLMKKYKREK